MRGSRVVVAALALMPWCAAFAATTICCIEESGRRSCADILPTQCYGRAYWEINERGVTVRRVEAPLTAEQRAQRDAEQRRKKEEERIVQEQKRKDQALLDTYASIQDIELFRERAIRDLDKAIADAKAEQVQLHKKRKSLVDEANSFKATHVPFEVSTAIKDVESEIHHLQTVIDAKLRNIDTVNTKFDDDKRRYVELLRTKPGTGERPQASSSDTKPR